jgi:uncharacterized protein YecE (DUF72 family)
MHRLRLAGGSAALDAFLTRASGLGDKLGPVLLQLPPSLALDPQRVRACFAALRRRFEGSVVCEPRHPDCFTSQADDLLTEFRISRVGAARLSWAQSPSRVDGTAFFEGRSYTNMGSFSFAIGAF